MAGVLCISKRVAFMKKFSLENAILLLLSIVAVSAGYLFFRYSYEIAGSFPFSQEIVLLLLGAIITSSITAVLLNRQTEVELRKEESIKYINLKMDIYNSLIDSLEASVVAGETTREDIIRLRFHSQKLALVASPAVLDQFGIFLAVYSDVSREPDLLPGETDQVMEALARLTISIRQDIGPARDRSDTALTLRISRQIIQNIEKLPEMRK
jgi:hypothetical protein